MIKEERKNNYCMYLYVLYIQIHFTQKHIHTQAKTSYTLVTLKILAWHKTGKQYMNLKDIALQTWFIVWWVSVSYFYSRSIYIIIIIITYLLENKIIINFTLDILDCEMVHSECVLCSGEDSDDCTECNDGFYLAEGTCAGNYYT